MMNALLFTYWNIFQMKMLLWFRKTWWKSLQYVTMWLSSVDIFYYPGEVLQVLLGTSAKILAMERSGPKFWKSLSREDVLEYTIHDIIKTIESPASPSRFTPWYLVSNWTLKCREFFLSFPLVTSSLNNIDIMLFQCLWSCNNTIYGKVISTPCICWQFLVDGERCILFVSC